MNTDRARKSMLRIVFTAVPMQAIAVAGVLVYCCGGHAESPVQLSKAVIGAPEAKLTPEKRCRIVLGALKNADGSPFVDSGKDTLARHIAGVIGGSQGEQAVTGDLESQCKLALEIWRQTWTQHVVTREANVKARAAAETEKTKVTSELNFGESLLTPQAKP